MSKIERAREREWLHRAMRDPEVSLATSIEPKPYVSPLRWKAPPRRKKSPKHKKPSEPA